MAIYARKNLVINTTGPNPLLIRPTTNGAVLIYDATLGSFITPDFTNPTDIVLHSDGTGVAITDNAVDLDLYFASLVAGQYVTISKNTTPGPNFGEITISAAAPAAIVVATIAARDALTGLVIGAQVFVQDTGQGENAFYIWDGSAFKTLSTQDSVATDSQTLVATVNYDSGSSVPLGPGRVSPGSKIVDVCVEVIIPFNGILPTLTVGDDTNGINVIMDDTLNDLSIVDEFGMECSYLYGGLTETTIKAYLSGGGSTQGQAIVTVTYA